MQDRLPRGCCRRTHSHNRIITTQLVLSLLLLLVCCMDLLPRASAAVRPVCNQTQSDDAAPNCVLLGSMLILTTTGQPYLPYPTPGSRNQTLTGLTGVPYWPLVRFQLARMNADASLLPHTRLESLLYDTQVSPGRSLFGTLELIQSGAQAIIGPLGSFLSTNAALVTAQLQVPQLSFTASSAALADKALYPTFYRVCQNDAYQGRALVYMMRQVFGWNSVALISTDEPYGSGVVSTFSDYASLSNLTISASVSFNNGASATDILPLMKRMRDSGARIFAYLGQPESFPSVMLAADSLGMINNHTVWWTSDAMVYGQYDDHIMELARGALSLTPQGGIGPNWDQFTKDFVAFAKQDALTALPAERWIGTEADVPPYAAFLVDSLSTVAHALHEIIEVQQNYRYTSVDLLNQLNLVDFQGYSGRIKFDANLDRTGIEFQLQNLQPAGWKPIGIWNAVNETNQWMKFAGAGNVVFRDGTTNVPPSEDVPASPLPEEPELLSAQAYTALLVLPSILLAALLFSGLIIVLFRTSRVVHSAAPNLLALVVLGGMMILISVIISVFPQTIATCTAQAWLAHLGFILSFGVLILKTYRVHRILANQSLELSTFDDVTLLKVIGCFLLFDITFLLARCIAAPYQQTVTGDLSCVSAAARTTLAGALMGTLFVEKALIIIVGVYVCWTARNLPQLFKEQFYTSILAYNILVLAVIWVGVQYGTARSDRGMVSFQGAILTIMVALLICFILIPKGLILVQMELPRLRLQFLGNAPPRLATGGMTSKRKHTVGESVNGSGPHIEPGTMHNGESSLPTHLQGGVKSILRVLNNVHVERVRLLHHHVRELARLQSNVLTKQTEVEQDRDLIYQIRTEADYYKAIGDKAKDEHVVQLFLERLNQFVPSVASYMSDVDVENNRLEVAVEGPRQNTPHENGSDPPKVVGEGGSGQGSAELAGGSDKKKTSGSNGGQLPDGSKSSNITPTPNSRSERLVATKVQMYSAVRGVLRESALKSQQQQHQQQQQFQQYQQPPLRSPLPDPDRSMQEATPSDNISALASQLGDADSSGMLNPPFNSMAGIQSQMHQFEVQDAGLGNSANGRMYSTRRDRAGTQDPLSPVMEQIELAAELAQLRPQTSPTETVPGGDTSSQATTSRSHTSGPASPDTTHSSHNHEPTSHSTKEPPTPAATTAATSISSSEFATTTTASTSSTAASSSNVTPADSPQLQQQRLPNIGSESSSSSSSSSSTSGAAASPSTVEFVASNNQTAAAAASASASSGVKSNVVFHMSNGRNMDFL